MHTLCRVRRPRGLKGNLVPASSRCSLVVVPGQGVQLGHWPKDLDTCLGGEVPEEKGTVSVCPQGWDKGGQRDTQAEGPLSCQRRQAVCKRERREAGCSSGFMYNGRTTHWGSVGKTGAQRD